jgi:hypothetical protein
VIRAPGRERLIEKPKRGIAMSREKPEAIFEKYLESPDKLNSEELRLALDFQDNSPVEALNIRRRREAERRERDARELAQATWIRQGGDASQFEAAYKQLSAVKRKEQMVEAEAEARASSLRSMWRDF